MTLIEPSFIHDWEFRDNRSDDLEEVSRTIRVFAVIVLLLGFIVTVAHFTVEPKVPQVKAAIVDETTLCANPLTSGPEINRYCIELAKRGL